MHLLKRHAPHLFFLPETWTWRLKLQHQVCKPKNENCMLRKLHQEDERNLSPIGHSWEGSSTLHCLPLVQKNSPLLTPDHFVFSCLEPHPSLSGIQRGSEIQTWVTRLYAQVLNHCDICLLSQSCFFPLVLGSSEGEITQSIRDIFHSSHSVSPLPHLWSTWY